MRDERAASIEAGQPIPLTELGRRYGVAKSTAGKIVAGVNWSVQVPMAPPRRVASVFDLGRLA